MRPKRSFKIIAIIIFLLFITASVFAIYPVHQWTVQPGTSSLDVGRDVITDSEGYIYITGRTHGNLHGNINHGDADIFLSKYDPDGNLIWTKQPGTPVYDTGFKITIDLDDNIYIVGETRGNLDGNINKGGYDVFITKYDKSGDWQWTRQPGTSLDDYIGGIAYDSSSDTHFIFIVGYTNGGMDGNTNKGALDIFILKCDLNGNWIWTKQPGTSSWDRGYGISVDTLGYIYITGFTHGGLDGNSNKGGADIIISKYDNDGNLIWTKQPGTSSDDVGFEITTDLSNNVYVVGRTMGGLDGNTNKGGNDIVITKYDSNGNWQWTRQPGTPNDRDYGRHLVTDSEGNVYIVGYTNGGLDGNINHGDIDIVISKYDADGNWKWTEQPGTPQGDGASGITIVDDKIIYVVGNTEGDLLGNINHGDWDIFLSKYCAGFVISGTVTDGVDPISDVEMSILELPEYVVMTNELGNYEFHLPEYATYTIVPSKEHWTFTPENRIYTNLSENINDADFTGVFFHDYTPPVTELIISQPNIFLSSKYFITYDTHLSLVVTDDQSEIKNTYYKFNDGSWIEYVGGYIDFSHLEYGPHTIYYYSIDACDNIEDEKSTELFIDNRPPESEVSFGEPCEFEGDVYTITKNTPISIISSDADGCGVDQIFYTLGSETVPGTIYTEPFNLSAYTEGFYTLKYYAKDMLENAETVKSVNIKLITPLIAVIDFDPDTLNLDSEGLPVIVYIELPTGYSVSDIDIFSILLNDEIECLASPTEIGDYNSNGIPDLMVQFNRKAVQDILEVGNNIEIKITGNAGVNPFVGYDYIKTIKPKYDDHTAVMNNKITPTGNSKVQIYTRLSEPTQVKITIFTLSGKPIRTIFDEYKGSGAFETLWDGTDEAGRIIASGVYLINIKTERFNETKKVLIVK